MKDNYSPVKIAQIQNDVTRFLRSNRDRGDGHYHDQSFLGQRFGVHPEDIRTILEPLVSDGQLDRINGPSGRKAIIPGLIYRTIPGYVSYRANLSRRIEKELA